VGIDKPILITDFATSSGTFTGTFTGGVTAGDTAVLLPPVGSKGWNLNSDGTNIDFKSDPDDGHSIRIVDVDTDLELVYFILQLHQFGNYMTAVS
jgi:hypothetical protein